MIAIENPYPASLREKKGIQLIADEKYKEARNQLKAAIKVRPSPLALKHLLDLEIKENNLNHAINYYNQIIKIYPTLKEQEWLKNFAEKLIREVTKKTKKIKSKKHENKPLKIATIGAVWKRPKLTEIFIKHLDRLFQDNLLQGVQHRAFLAVSEEIWLKKSVALKFPNCEFVETDNFPLSYKWQSALESAKLWKPDIILIMGSDNFISQNLLLKLITPLVNGDHHFCGLGDCAMVDNNEVIRWRGYNITNQPHRSGEPIGAARVISAQLLNEVEWDLWSASPINKGLDSLVMKKLENLGYLYANTSFLFNEKTFEINKLKILENTTYTETVVDIKTSVNVTSTDDTITNENFELWNDTILKFLSESTGNDTTSKEIVKYLDNGRE